MDKIQFVQGFYPEDIHLNGIQDAAEAADKRLASALAGAGIVTGLEVTMGETAASISSGMGFDKLGRVIHSEAVATVDLSVITRPSSGAYKWVSIVASFIRNSYGDAYDDSNQRHDLYQDEAMSLSIVQGSEGSLAGAEKPSVGNDLLLADLLIDEATAFESITPNTLRCPSIETVIALKSYVAEVINEGADKLITATNWGKKLLLTSPPFSPVPWNKSFCAMLSSPVISGTANGDIGMCLVDTTKDFSSVSAGAVVRNPITNQFARVLIKISTTQLLLDLDIFPSGTELYEIFAEPLLPENFLELTGPTIDNAGGTRVANTDTDNHLIDTGGTVWTGVVAVGDWVMNLNTGRVAQVTAVAAHDLTLLWDCFPSGNEPYLIFANWITINDDESLVNGKKVQELNMSGRYLGGRLSGGNVELDTMHDHEHRIAPRTYSAGSALSPVNGAAESSGTQGNSLPLYTNTMTASSAKNGTPRLSDHTQPRTLGQVYIMRIK